MNGLSLSWRDAGPRAGFCCEPISATAAVAAAATAAEAAAATAATAATATAATAAAGTAAATAGTALSYEALASGLTLASGSGAIGGSGVTIGAAAGSTLLGSIGSAVTAASPYLSAASAAVGALGSMQAGKAQQQAARYNARVAENNAIGAVQVGAEQANRQNLAGRKALATGLAAAGASGTDPTSGSALDVLADNAGAAAMAEEDARWQAGVTASGFAQDARLSRYQGKTAAANGRIQAGGTLLSAIGSRAIGAYATSKGLDLTAPRRSP